MRAQFFKRHKPAAIQPNNPAKDNIRTARIQADSGFLNLPGITALVIPVPNANKEFKDTIIAIIATPTGILFLAFDAALVLSIAEAP